MSSSPTLSPTMISTYFPPAALAPEQPQLMAQTAPSILDSQQDLNSRIQSAASNSIRKDDKELHMDGALTQEPHFITSYYTPRQLQLEAKATKRGNDLAAPNVANAVPLSSADVGNEDETFPDEVTMLGGIPFRIPFRYHLTSGDKPIQPNNTLYSVDSSSSCDAGQQQLGAGAGAPPSALKAITLPAIAEEQKSKNT